jgi:hypothetical protein
MNLSVCGLVIDFRRKDVIVRVFTSSCDCPIDYLADAETKTTCLEEVFFDSAVYGGARAPLPALIVSESVLWDNFSCLVDRILCHYVQRSHHETWDRCNMRERNREAISVLHVLADEVS